MKSKFISFNIKKPVLTVFIISVFLLGSVYFLKTSIIDLNNDPTETPDLTTKRGGTIHAKVFCIENNNKIPCKGGFSIKSKIGNDQEIIRTSDEDGNLTASFEVGEYLLFPLPSSNSIYNSEEILPNEIEIRQGKVIDIEVFYKSDSR
mgnify:CR=1 FL=1